MALEIETAELTVYLLMPRDPMAFIAIRQQFNPLQCEPFPALKPNPT